MKEENLSSKKRTIIIKGVNPFVPLIDIYTQLIKSTGEIKKISLVHNPSFPGISLGIFQVDYIDHQSALNAIKIINEDKKLSMIEGNIIASFPDISIDNLNQIMIDSSHVLSFENLNINVTNALEFKNYLIQFLTINNNSNIQILKLRQYSNKIVVIFNEIPSCLKKFIDNETNYFVYKSKNIPIKPMIKPIVNIGKYKEKTIKLSSFSLLENDKNRIINRIINKGKIPNDEISLKKKAEILYNQIQDEERREQEREDYNNRFSINRKRERENSDRKRYPSNENDSRRRNEDYNNNKNNNINSNDINGGLNQLTQLANLLNNPTISQLIQLLSNQELDFNKIKNVQNSNLNNLNNNQNNVNQNNQNLQNQINLNQNQNNTGINNTNFNQLQQRNLIEENNNIGLNLNNNNLNTNNILNQDNNSNNNVSNSQQNYYFQQPNLNSIIANNPQLLSLIQNYEQHQQQLNQNNIISNPNFNPSTQPNQNNPIPNNQNPILNNMNNNNQQIPFNPLIPPWNNMFI